MLGHPTSSSGHIWKFFRRSGLDQVSLETAADLQALGELDQKLWVALACPVKGLEMDEKTLSLIDSDGDGRIRPAELIAALHWAAARLADPADLLKGVNSLTAAAIRSDSDEGKAMAAAARLILPQAGKKESDGLTVEDIIKPGTNFAPDRIRGNGLVPPAAAPDADSTALIQGFIAGLAGKPDSAGAIRKQFDTFFAELESFAGRNERAADPALAVLGEGTATGLAVLIALRTKVQDYFVRCRLADFDPLLIGAANRPEGDTFTLPAKPLSPNSAELVALPLARIEPGKPLPLQGGVNPAWAGALADLRTTVVAPLFGADKSSLTEAEWNALLGRFAAFQTWLETKVAGVAEALGLKPAAAVLSAGGQGRLAGLIEGDQALAPGYAAAADLERLARYHRDLRTLLHNFINFADFYSRQRRAVFQAGTLFLDSRSCDLCTRADNPAQHAILAAMGRFYIAYVECRRAGSPVMTIAACFTQGDSNYLSVGRNGVFYDRQGKDWDGTIVKIIDNPISVRQAFMSPYKRVANFVEEQIAKFAAAKDQATTASLGQGVIAAGAVPDPAAKASSQPFDIAKFAGIFAAIGLAIGAIGGAVASVAVGFMHLAPWQMPLAIVGALLIISGPAMLIAAIKLHQRNLGPLLEASGWAVNGRVKINFTLGKLLTQRAALPPGSQRHLHDPYKDKAMHRRRILYLVLLLAVAALVTAKIQGFWPFSP